MKEREDLNQNTQPEEILNQEEQYVNQNEQSTNQKKRQSEDLKGLKIDQSALATFIETLAQERGGKVYIEKGYAVIRCPFHDDEYPSLSVSMKTGHFHCFACGETGSIVKLIEGLAREWDKTEGKTEGEDFGRSNAITFLKRAGILKQDKPKEEATYYYYLPPYYFFPAYRKRKLRYADGRKTFVYEHYDHEREMWVVGKPKDCPPLLYNGYGVEKAREKGKAIFFVEGEKDVETLKALGLYATTSGGANDWHPELAKEFEGMEVALIPDNDVAGKTWLVKVGTDLLNVAKEVYWVDLSEEAKKLGLELKEGGDITDLLELVGEDREKRLEVIKGFDYKPFDLEAIKEQQEEETLKGFEWFLKAEDLEGKNLEFLFEGFLPYGYVVVLSGEAGVGKTWLSYGLVKQAIKQGVKVVYLDADNSLPYIKQMLEDFDLYKELGKNLFILSRQKAEVSISKDNSKWKAVKRLLNNVDRCLVIVDTLGSFSRGYDPNSDRDMREVMSELKETRDMGHAVLVLHHTQKYASFDDSQPVETKYRGSAVIKSDADGLYYINREDNSYYLHAGKLRFMGSSLVVITLTVEGAKIEPQTTESKLEKDARRLLDLMEEGKEYTRQDIIELAKTWYDWGRDKTLKLLKLIQDKGLLEVQKSQKSKGKGYVYIKPSGQQSSGQGDATDDLLTDF
ncbi:AAA family ATPase [Hydrogenobacter sp. T-2]|uniref:AAA family ATPase n=1 Tax=Pampinifervens diazotrophicum TaxID=1632018 RepID=UPI002B257698|nr:AAA family ATPase [Hydrogenobacter sp. T-2]WPM31227.1 AAA family ATPase [Hydrogenobacter sp. T-2]